MKRFLRVHGKSPLHLGRGACVSARQGRDSYVSPGYDIISGRCDNISVTLNSSQPDEGMAHMWYDCTAPRLSTRAGPGRGVCVFL